MACCPFYIFNVIQVIINLTKVLALKLTNTFPPQSGPIVEDSDLTKTPRYKHSFSNWMSNQFHIGQRDLQTLLL